MERIVRILCSRLRFISWTFCLIGDLLRPVKCPRHSHFLFSSITMPCYFLVFLPAPQHPGTSSYPCSTRSSLKVCYTSDFLGRIPRNEKSCHVPVLYKLCHISIFLYHSC